MTATAPAAITWNSGQKQAIDTIEAWIESPKPQSPIISLTGPAGSGKTTLLSALSKSLSRAAWTAMTGKASVRLQQAAGVTAKTLHSTLYKPPEDSEGGPQFSELMPPVAPVLVVDEASMMTPTILRDLQQWMSRGVKVLLIGDGFQLPPILSKEEEAEHGKNFTVFSRVKGPALETVMRSDSAIINAATKIRQTGIIPRLTGPSYNVAVAQDPARTAAVNWINDPDDHVLITWRNDARMFTNELIRTMRGIEGGLQIGEPIVIRQNGQGCLNGELYMVTNIEPGPFYGPVPSVFLTLNDGKKITAVTAGNAQYMDGGMPYLNSRDWTAFKKSCGISRPISVSYGYVLTAHSMQGSEARRVTVFLTSADFDNPAFCAMTALPSGGKAMMAARWSYTAITRAKQRVDILLNR